MNMKGNVFHLKIIRANIHGLGIMLGTGAYRDEPEAHRERHFVAKKSFKLHESWEEVQGL